MTRQRSNAVAPELWQVGLGRVPPLIDLAAITGADSPGELWRWLIDHPNGGRDTLILTAISVFRRLHSIGDDTAVRSAGLLLTDRRWSRITGQLVAEIQAAGLLSDSDTQSLARALLFDQQLRWSLPASVVMRGGAQRLPRAKRSPRRELVVLRPIAPPLRRWAAARLIEHDPALALDIMSSIDAMPARDGDAAMQGLLDGSQSLSDAERDLLIERGLGWPAGPVRRVALGLVVTLAGPEAAARIAATDPAQNIRAWAAQLIRTAPGDPTAAVRGERGGATTATTGKAPLQPTLFD